MEPIDPQALTTVRGGFGALLTALPGILSGISGLVTAFKGSGSSPQPQQPQPAAAAPLSAGAPVAGAPSASTAPSTQMASGGPSPTPGFDPSAFASMVTNIIKIG